MFNSLTDNLSASFKKLGPKKTLTEEDITKTLKEVRIALLEADVALPVVKDFMSLVKTRALGQELSQALDPAQQLVKIVNEELVTLLGGKTRYIRFNEVGATVIMLSGLQGVGKTTFAGKLAHWLKEEDLSVLLVAADLHRPNAVNQLKVNGGRAGAEVFAPEPGNGVGDPVEVAARGVEKGRAEGFDVIIIDTAGRLGVDTLMMEQARAIQKAVIPDETLFVIDAMMGQSALETALAFKEALAYDGIILNKTDGDARGGASLSLRATTGAPIMFVGTGEKIEDLELFHPDRMAGRILNMGDVLTLIEQAEKKFDVKQAAEVARRAAAGTFTLEDFIKQLEQLQRLGSLTKVIGFLPGMKDLKEQVANIDEKQMARKKAMIYAMTPAERQDYRIIDDARAARIAKGSGNTVEDLRDLVERFVVAQRLMQKMMQGQVPEELKTESKRRRPKPPR